MSLTIEVAHGATTQPAGSRTPQKPEPIRFRGQPVIRELSTDFSVVPGGPVKRSSRSRWPVSLYRDPDDPKGRVTVVAISLRGVASEGATEEEALNNIMAVIAAVKDEIDEIFDLDRARSYDIPLGGRVVYVNGPDDAQAST